MANIARTLRRAAERNAAKLARKQARVAPCEANSSIETPELNPVPEAQFTANRLNAPDEPAIFSEAKTQTRSTGPRTEAGKAISSRNHTIHGLTVNLEKSNGAFQVLPTENQADFDHGVALMRAQWQPANVTEEDLVERLVIHMWLTRRAQRLMDKIIMRCEDAGMSKEDLREFQTYERYYNSHQRHYNKALADLMRLKNFDLRRAKQQQQMEERAAESAAKEQIRFESQKRAATKHETQMQILNLRLEAQKLRTEKVQKAPRAVETPQAMAA